jgi:hypothetical protein
MKNIKFLSVILLSVLLSVSCNNDADNISDLNDSALRGVWESSEVDDGEELNITLTFNSNNTGSLVSKFTFDGETETESENFTWSTKGNKLTLIIYEDPTILTYSILGDKLTIMDEDGDVIFILTKV